MKEVGTICGLRIFVKEDDEIITSQLAFSQLEGMMSQMYPMTDNVIMEKADKNNRQHINDLLADVDDWVLHTASPGCATISNDIRQIRKMVFNID